MPVVLVATLDTKGRELAFVRDLLHAAGLATLVIDAGSLGPPAFEPDIDRDRVFFRDGSDLEAIRRRGDRGEAVAAAARGVASLVAELDGQGKVQGILSLGGSAGTTIGTAAMRALPFGLPKVMVSTLASGQTRPYVGGSDICMLHSVADLAGLNRLTRQVLTNAANAMAGMVLGQSRQGEATQELLQPHRPGIAYLDESEDVANRSVIAATMFGVTTPCVDRARQVLEGMSCEVLVFHATGVGGQAMEGLIRDGQVQGVLDLTTTELADELVGGVLSAGPDRLEAAGRRGIPQVVSLGALDMVNFGPRATVPERFADRTFHVHNPNVTLMRTTPEENAALGARIAQILSRAHGPTVLLVPRGGVSALDAPGQPFWDPEADNALFEALRDGLSPRVRLIELQEHINNPAFAESAALILLALMDQRGEADQGGLHLPPRWAQPDDLPGIEELLWACDLPRTAIAEHLDGFLVIQGPGRLLACACLERHAPWGLLRSVAVIPDLRGFGLGSRLVATLLNRAAAEGLESVALQTFDAAEFFARKFRFEPIDRAALATALASSSSWNMSHCDSAPAMQRTLQPTET